MPPFPMRSTAAVSLLFSLFALVTQCLDAQSPEEKKSKEGIFECYTCLGRNYENCMFGQTLCAGACWKMIDEKHELIAKGCTAEDKSDNKEESDVDTKVKLPWSPNGAETIQDQTDHGPFDHWIRPGWSLRASPLSLGMHAQQCRLRALASLPMVTCCSS
uniref:Uncharacterized protein n=1 Tax=Trichuris muris TaxID=70415 RepID=A0A5S6QY68_TRIMR